MPHVKCHEHSCTLYFTFLHVNLSLIFQLSKLKSDLNDVLYSDKWTPDAYLLAKSYVADDMPTNTRCVTLIQSYFHILINSEIFTRHMTFIDFDFFSDKTRQLPDLFRGFIQENRPIQEGELLNTIR